MPLREGLGACNSCMELYQCSYRVPPIRLQLFRAAIATSCIAWMHGCTDQA